MSPRVRRWLAVSTVIAAAACSGSDPAPPGPAASEAGSTAVGTVDASSPATSAGASGSTAAPSGTAPTSDTVGEETAVDTDGEIVVDLAGAPRPFDRRLLGTNAPAWISPEKFADPAFQQSVLDMGTTLIRMPGGSWSNSYDWLACENDDESGCAATWASRPSDFVGFLADTGIAGMWTVSFNGTAEEAAALVAFFNGNVDDERPIGVDRRGRDWATVGQWARLRAANGHPEPQRIELWEVGNEIYGAKAEAGPDCASFGWEDVWTCDGSAYVSGDDDHDGFVRFRDKMREVDPDILVGAVGIGGSQSEWGNFGNEVIEGAGDALDFYIVHDYGFNENPSTNDVLRRPERAWADMMDDVSQALDERNPGRAVPVAITEYNLFAFLDGDTEGLMAEAINALYIAETVGQMAEQGVSIANQWNLINGVTPSGSDYGVFDPESGEPNPQFYALAMWSSIGDELLPAESGFESDALTAYAARASDGTIAVLAINKTDTALIADVRLPDLGGPFTAAADVASADSLDSAEMSYNGSSGAVSNLDAYPSTDLGTFDGGTLVHSFAPYSITVVRVTPAGSA